MNDVLRKVTDFRLITLAVASTLSIAAANADARPAEGESKRNTAAPAACSAAVAPTARSMRRGPTAMAV